MLYEADPVQSFQLSQIIQGKGFDPADGIHLQLHMSAPDGIESSFEDLQFCIDPHSFHQGEKDHRIGVHGRCPHDVRPADEVKGEGGRVVPGGEHGGLDHKAYASG